MLKLAIGLVLGLAVSAMAQDVGTSGRMVVVDKFIKVNEAGEVYCAK